MKTSANTLKAIKQYVLIGIIILTALFGLSLKTNAQSTMLNNDVDKIRNAMVIQLADYDFDIIIPKMNEAEFEKIDDALFNQMVYVMDGAAGYYFYRGAKWEMQSVRDVFELIDINIAIQEPSSESMIVVADTEHPKKLLDYNDHVKNVYKDFAFDHKDKSLAINIRKE